MSYRYSRHLIWLLAVIVLLIQTMAVWHDAEHAFHDHITLCDQLNSVSHTPSITLNNSLDIQLRQPYLQLIVAAVVSGRFGNTYHSLTIRGPPIFS